MHQFKAMVLPALAAILCTNPAYAEPSIDVADVTAALIGDWNGDGTPDSAVLATPGKDRQEVALYIFLGSGPDARPHLAAHNPRMAWQGMLWGRMASLSTNERGSLVVQSGNESIGRHRWQRRVTIAYRGERFVVAGHSYEARDTLDLEQIYVCDINLLTGKGTRNGEPVRVTLRAPLVSEWNDALAEQTCGEPE